MATGVASHAEGAAPTCRTRVEAGSLPENTNFYLQQNMMGTAHAIPIRLGATVIAFGDLANRRTALAMAGQSALSTAVHALGKSARVSGGAGGLSLGLYGSSVNQ